MTVVATLLAGLSSGEMTRAQYFRSLAAQNQSKVGDQWAFFQAKRARGTSNDLTVKLLRAMSDAHDVDPEALRALADRLCDQLRVADKPARDLAAQIDKAKLGSPGEPLRTAAQRLGRVAAEKNAKADALRQRIAEALQDADVKMALACLRAGALPEAAGGASPAAQDPRIQEALEEIGRRKTVQETEALVAPIPDADLQRAIRDTENRAKAFDETGKPIGKALERVDKLIDEMVVIARSYARAADAVREAADAATAGGGNVPPEPRQAVTALARNAATLKASVNELNNNFTAAQLRYNAWRYEHEARDNQRAAGLYEIQVRKNSWTAERHRLRSIYFFYGMLAAQAGVTIASLALAVKLRSLLWGLASFAGLVAVCIAAYVYIYV